MVWTNPDGRTYTEVILRQLYLAHRKRGRQKAREMAGNQHFLLFHQSISGIQKENP